MSEKPQPPPLADNASHSHSDAFLHSLMNAIPDLVWLKDPDGIFLSCNTAFEQFFGTTEASVIGKSDYDFVPREQADIFREYDKRVMATGTTAISEELIENPATGASMFLETKKTPVRDETGRLIGVLGIARDITIRKNTEETLEKRLASLTSPLTNNDDIAFEDLLDIDRIQRLQDQFAKATGVASIITHVDGTPITRPSKFCRLCNDIIRQTEQGRANCYRSDAAIGRLNKDGPTVRHCMSGGLWDAGAGISIGGRHVANWLIGQVRDETLNESVIREYARKIGADEEAAAEAFHEVTPMQRERFEDVARVLFLVANLLSEIAYRNILQARFIADLKRTETELAQTRNYLSNIINSMPSVLVGVNPDGVVTQWNNEAEHASQVSSDNAIGQPLEKVFPRLAREMDRVREAMRTRTVCSESIQSQGCDGDTRHEDVTIFPLIANGVNGAVIRIDDVTQRVNLEQMMVQSEKMMSVGGLAAGMAHEINNPLAGILGYTHNIEKRLLGDLKKNDSIAQECGISLECFREYLHRREIPKMLEGIRESGNRAATIVSNMLSFSRKTERKHTYHDLALLLDKTLELVANDYNLKKFYDFRKIKIVREYDPGMPRIYCDGNEMQQVFLNLLKNGAEAMIEKNYGKERPQIICRIRQADTLAVVEIEDNGPGLDSETRKRIFEPFFTTKGVGKGTGLGLSVSYFIVTNQHRGAMEVDSMHGQWTRFSIMLPLISESCHDISDSDS